MGLFVDFQFKHVIIILFRRSKQNNFAITSMQNLVDKNTEVNKHPSVKFWHN